MPVMNTTKTVGKGKEATPIEKVEKKLKAIGCKNYGWYRGVVITDDMGMKDKSVNVGLQGQMFVVRLGEVSDIPEPLYEILKNANMVMGGVYEPPKKEPVKAE